MLYRDLVRRGDGDHLIEKINRETQSDQSHHRSRHTLIEEVEEEDELENSEKARSPDGGSNITHVKESYSPQQQEETSNQDHSHSLILVADPEELIGKDNDLLQEDTEK